MQRLGTNEETSPARKAARPPGAPIRRASARDALHELEALTGEGLRGDPVAAYLDFVTAVERSREQAAQLAARAEPLQAASDELYARWSADLERFALPALRQRSRARMDDTHARSEEVQVTLERAQAALEAYNMGLSDVATFLGNDLNLSAMADLDQEVRALRDYSAELDDRLVAVLSAAEEYVTASALPGTVEVVGPDGLAAADR